MARRLTTVLAADVVGYSRLMGEDEAGTLSALKSLRRQLIKPKELQYQGRTVKLMGDGALMEFASVVDAVTFAIEVQVAIAKRNSEIGTDRKIIYRIGINIGDIIVEGDDIYGDGVNVAARLEALCEPGGIYIARNVFEQVKGKLDLTIENLGEKEVKNIVEPVTVYRVALDDKADALVTPVIYTAAKRASRRWPAIAAGFFLGVTAVSGLLLWQPWVTDLVPSSDMQTAISREKPSIAVLPFENLDGEAATGRLADGIARDIITDLARFRDLDVIAHNSTAVYKDKTGQAGAIGKDLNVRYVLDGSIQSQLDRVRVTAQLIDATTETNLWSERWDRPADDIFAIQTEVAERVVSALGGKSLLFGESRAAAKRKRPSDLVAYDFWVLSADALLQTNETDLRRGVAYADEAISKDPGLVRAYTEKGWLLLNLAKYDKNYLEAYKEMERLARKAISIDPYDAEAHTLLSFATGGLGDLSESKRATDRALELNPSSADILNIAASGMAYFGKPEEGAEMCDRSFRLNPDHPNWYYLDCPEAYFFTGRYQDVIDIMDRYDAVGDLFSGGLIWRAASQAELGKADAAAASVAELVQRYPEVSMEYQLNTGWVFEREQEEQQIVASARRAGIRICATGVELKEFASPRQLQECIEDRRKG